MSDTTDRWSTSHLERVPATGTIHVPTMTPPPAYETWNLPGAQAGGPAVVTA